MVNDGIGNGNFTTLKPFAFYTQHVLPSVYGDEISYAETLGKIRDILNELIKNNNNLPTYIQQMIEEYISSGAIEEVIDKILSNLILNVKYPPAGIPKAKGDGTTNDHDSIQGCIDYAESIGGGIVYLPAGKYLTTPLILRTGVTLLGFGRYATSLNLAGGAITHLITGTVNDAGLVNLTLNAKMSSQVNRVDAVELIGHHIEIRNVVAKDCYTSINIQKNGAAITISNVLCETASDACLRVGGTDGGLLVDGLEMTGLSTNLGVAYIVTDSNGDIYRNININGTGALGIDVGGSQNYFDGNISGVTKDYEDLSGDNTFELFGKSSVKNYTNDVVENANTFSQVAANGIERQGANISDNSTNTHTINAKNAVINSSNSHTINGKDVIINSTNPLTYKTPENFNGFLSGIPLKDSQNDLYYALTDANSDIINFSMNYANNTRLEYTQVADLGKLIQSMSYYNNYFYVIYDNVLEIYDINFTLVKTQAINLGHSNSACIIDGILYSYDYYSNLIYTCTVNGTTVTPGTSITFTAYTTPNTVTMFKTRTGLYFIAHMGHFNINKFFVYAIDSAISKAFIVGQYDLPNIVNSTAQDTSPYTFNLSDRCVVAMVSNNKSFGTGKITFINGLTGAKYNEFNFFNLGEMEGITFVNDTMYFTIENIVYKAENMSNKLDIYPDLAGMVVPPISAKFSIINVVNNSFYPTSFKVAKIPGNSYRFTNVLFTPYGTINISSSDTALTLSGTLIFIYNEVQYALNMYMIYRMPESINVINAPIEKLYISAFNSDNTFKETNTDVNLTGASETLKSIIKNIFDNTYFFGTYDMGMTGNYILDTTVNA